MSNQKRSKFTEPQNIIAVGVTIISLCALIVSLMQTQIMKEEREIMRSYSRASVWPRLDLGLSKSHHLDNSIKSLRYILSNNGVGPAIITDVKVEYKGQPATDWWDLFEIQAIPDSVNTFIGNIDFNDIVVSSGESLVVLNLDQNQPLAREFFKRINDIDITIHYESIYEEQWKWYNGKVFNLKNFKGLPEEVQFY